MASTQRLQPFQMPAPEALDVGTKPTLTFGSSGKGVRYLSGGWTPTPESWGVWSEKAVASLELPLAKLPDSDLTVALTIGAFLTDKHPTERADILLNGSTISRLGFTLRTASQRQVLKLPVSLIGRDKVLHLSFRPSAPISPLDLGLSNDPRSLSVSLTELQISEPAQPETLDVGSNPTLRFGTNGNGVKYLGEGWSAPEGWGVWSEKAVASLELPLAKLPDSDLTVALTIGAFLTDKHPTERADILLNGSTIARLGFTLQTASQRQVLKLPVSLIGRDKVLHLSFRPSAPISPLDLGLSNDPRSLGVSLTELQIVR